MPPGRLMYEDNLVYAQPAFRVICLIDAPLSSAPMRQAAAAVLDLFLAAAQDRLALYAYAGGKTKALKPKPISAKGVAEAHTIIAQEPWEWPSTLRFNGWFEEPHNSVAPPHLRIERYAHLSLFQIELPPDDVGLADFSDRILAILAGLPVVWGVMGLGMYQPVSADSLIWMLPRVTPRYRCAIEVQPDFARNFVRRAKSNDDLLSGKDPVAALPDIGWRTLIGAEFYDRLPDLADLATVQGVALEGFAAFGVITAGPAPIWGDVNIDQDIAPYRAIAAALRPAWPDWTRVKNGLFGGHENDSGLDRIEAWYDRFAN